MRRGISWGAAAVFILVRGALAQPAGTAGWDGLAAGGPGAAAGTATRLRQAFDRLPGPPADRGGVHLLAENVEAWAARWALLEQARTSIETTYFIVADDVFGMAFMGHLLKKAEDGVRVRLMVDATGSPGFKLPVEGGKDILQELVKTGNADVRIYKPTHTGITNFLTRFELFTATASNHDKILVVDGEWGLSGGRNISKDYFLDAADHPTGFRDTDVLYRSAGAARKLSTAFGVEFDGPQTVKVELERWNAISRRERLLTLYRAMDQWMKAAPLSGAAAARLRSDPAAREAEAERMLAAAGEGPGARRTGIRGRLLNSYVDHKTAKHLAELAGCPGLRGSGGYRLEDKVGTDGEIRILDRTSLVGRGDDTLNPGLAMLVGAAEREILLENPYVVLVDRSLAVLEAAGRRGVRIEMLTNSPVSTDSLLTQAYFLQTWPEVLARVPGMRIRVMSGARKLHAKSGVIDETVALIGTYNMDLISAQVNGEVVVVVWSPALAAATKRSYEADLADPANRVVEYRIKPRAGTATPEVEFGPEHHIAPEELSRTKRASLALLEDLTRWTQDLPSLRPLMRIRARE